MKFLKYSWFAVALVLILAACALPEGRWTIDTRLADGTAWIGGPPMATEEAQATAIAIATEEAPQEESTPEPAECLVKGNVGRNREAIYHLPTGAYYDLVVVSIEQGDAWFCSEADAQAAGFRKSLR